MFDSLTDRGTIPGQSSVNTRRRRAAGREAGKTSWKSLQKGEVVDPEENQPWHFLTKCYPTKENHRTGQSKQQLAFQSKSLVAFVEALKCPSLSLAGVVFFPQAVFGVVPSEFPFGNQILTSVAFLSQEKYRS